MGPWRTPSSSWSSGSRSSRSSARSIALASSGGPWDHIGRGGIEPVRAETPGEDIAELRELLEARNARRVARGEPPLDVEAELSRRLREM